MKLLLCAAMLWSVALGACRGEFDPFAGEGEGEAGGATGASGGAGQGAADNTGGQPGSGGAGATGASSADGGAGDAGHTSAGGGDTTSGTGGNASGGSSAQGGAGGTAPGGLDLYEPCSNDGECDSGICDMGYCTIACVDFQDCGFTVGECIDVEGTLLCHPSCEQQSSCAAFGLQSLCAAQLATDATPVAVCGDWGAITLFDVGTVCIDDIDCHLGHDGQQRICDGFGCIVGCRDATDCVAPATCQNINFAGEGQCL